MQRIKVLEVIRQGQIGGGESHLLDLIHYMDKDRFEPVCLSFTGGEMISRLKQMGVVCYVIETNKPFDIQVQKRIKKLIHQEQIKIIHAHGSRAASNVLFSARQLKIPFIYTVHGWSFHDDQSYIIRKIRAWSEKLICRYSNHVICVSKSNADTGRDVFGLISATVIENGINLERFNPQSHFNDLRSTFGFSEDDFVIGFVARCTIQKNPVLFLEALKLAHDHNSKIKGLFVGEGDLDGEVDSFIRDHQMNDYLFRSSFRTDVPDILHCIDIYCLPSLWEGLSIALLEAMAMGKAIIATPTDGTKEMIRDGVNGLVVPFNNVQAVASAVERFYSDRYLKNLCSSAARQLIQKRFNAQRVADAVSEIYMKYAR
jgi:glycosyltransferase involved in cell wall biosynthesis